MLKVYERYFEYIDESCFGKSRRGAWPDSELDQCTSNGCDTKFAFESEKYDNFTDLWELSTNFL